MNSWSSIKFRITVKVVSSEFSFPTMSDAFTAKILEPTKSNTSNSAFKITSLSSVSITEAQFDALGYTEATSDIDNADFGKSFFATELNRNIFRLPSVRYSTIDNLPEVTSVDFNEIIQLNNFTINTVLI